MKLNSYSTQHDYNPQSVSAQARLLMSERRQKVQNRERSMLNRAALEVGLSA